VRAPPTLQVHKIALEERLPQAMFGHQSDNLVAQEIPMSVQSNHFLSTGVLLATKWHPLDEMHQFVASFGGVGDKMASLTHS